MSRERRSMATGGPGLLGIALAAAACGGATPVPPSAPAPTPAPSAQIAPRRVALTPPPAFPPGDRAAMVRASQPAFAAHVEAWQKSHAAPGLAVGVVVDGRLAHRELVGDAEDGSPIDVDSAFRIGSISKTFTASLAAILDAEGTLSLDAPAVAWLPALAGVIHPTRDAPRITLRHLLTHTAGLPTTDPYDYGDPNLVVTREVVLRGLEGLALHRAPGLRWAYSSLGINVASFAMSAAAGESFEGALQGRVLSPLAMDRTVWTERDVPRGRLATGHRRDGAPVPRDAHWRLGAGQAAGGLYSTLADMARWAAIQLDAYPPRDAADDGPLPRRVIRAMHEPGPTVELGHSSHEGDTKSWAVAQGLGWVVLQDCDFERVVFHNGALEGYFASVYLAPHYGIGVVALTNSRIPTAGLAREGLRTFVHAGGFEPRRPAYDPALREATEAALRLTHQWSDEAYARLYATSFRSIVDAPTWRAEMEKLRDRGACRYVRPITVTSPLEARFLFECDHGLVSAGGLLATGTTQFDRFGWSRLDAPPKRNRCE